MKKIVLNTLVLLAPLLLSAQENGEAKSYVKITVNQSSALNYGGGIAEVSDLNNDGKREIVIGSQK